MSQPSSETEKFPLTCVRWRPPEFGSRGMVILLSTSSDGSIQHWHLNTGRCISTIKETKANNLFCCDYNNEGSKFVAAGLDTKLHVYDEHTRAKIMEMKEGSKFLPGHSNRVFSVKFHPDDPNVLVSGGWDNSIQIYDLRKGQPVAAMYGPHICGDAIDVAGDFIAGGSCKGKDVVQIFSLSQR